MPKFFICYRREDGAFPAHLIHERLKAKYGAESAVIDVDNVPLGADFREYLDDQVRQCDVLLPGLCPRFGGGRDLRPDAGNGHERQDTDRGREAVGAWRCHAGQDSLRVRHTTPGPGKGIQLG